MFNAFLKCAYFPLWNELLTQIVRQLSTISRYPHLRERDDTPNFVLFQVTLIQQREHSFSDCTYTQERRRDRIEPILKEVYSQGLYPRVQFAFKDLMIH